MRITGGIHRSRPLRAPRGSTTRPTSDRVREALFGILVSAGAIEGANVLDLYAGTGALGIEAQLSTGFDLQRRGHEGGLGTLGSRSRGDCVNAQETTLELTGDGSGRTLAQHLEVALGLKSARGVEAVTQRAA